MKIQDAYTSEGSTLVLVTADGADHEFRHVLIGGEAFDVLSYEQYRSITGEKVLALEIRGKHEFSYQDEIILD